MLLTTTGPYGRPLSRLTDRFAISGVGLLVASHKRTYRQLSTLSGLVMGAAPASYRHKQRRCAVTIF